MSQVKLTIGNRSYTVACPDGQEAHIAKLGSMIDQRYSALGEAHTPQETQNLLFTALFLADELDEAKSAPAPAAEPAPPADDGDKGKQGKKAELKAEIEELRQSEQKLTDERDALIEELNALKEGGDSAQVDMFGEDVLAARLEELASRAELCAEALEGNGASS